MHQMCNPRVLFTPYCPHFCEVVNIVLKLAKQTTLNASLCDHLLYSERLSSSDTFQFQIFKLKQIPFRVWKTAITSVAVFLVNKRENILFCRGLCLFSSSEEFEQVHFGPSKSLATCCLLERCKFFSRKRFRLVISTTERVWRDSKATRRASAGHDSRYASIPLAFYFTWMKLDLWGKRLLRSRYTAGDIFLWHGDESGVDARSKAWRLHTNENCLMYFKTTPAYNTI